MTPVMCVCFSLRHCGVVRPCHSALMSDRLTSCCFERSPEVLLAQVSCKSLVGRRSGDPLTEVSGLVSLCPRVPYRLASPQSG